VRPVWRADQPPIQYLTHDLGPLLEVLDDRVVSVNRSDPKVDEANDETQPPQTGSVKKEPESTGSQEPSATTSEEQPFTGSVQGDRPPSPPQN